MNIYFRFVLVALATYFVAFQIVANMGPFNVGTKIRKYVIDRWLLGWQEETIACPVCLSLWIGAVLVPLTFWKEWQYIPLLWLGNSGACLIIHYALTNNLWDDGPKKRK